MRSTVCKLTAISCFVFGAIVSNAQQISNINNVVTTAVPFLRIAPDARSAGMGDVGIATAPDANAGFWNSAKIPFNENKIGVSASYTPWLKDILNDVALLNLSAFYKMDDDQAVSASLKYFNLGDIQFTDNQGNDLNIFRPREFGFDVGYSRRLDEKNGIGVRLRYISSNLAGNFASAGNTYKTGTAVAGDLSYFHQGHDEAGEGWAFGATLSNLGSKINYTDQPDQKDFIPANLGLGTAYTKVMDEQNKVSFALDINKLLVPTPPTSGLQADIDAYKTKGVMSSWFSSFGDAPGGFSEELKEFQLSAGAEYSYNNQFALRAGYFYEDKTKGNRRYFSMGVGVKYSSFGLDFSYLLPSGSGVTRNPLSNTLRFSLHFNFDGEAN